ncbi:MAG: flagellar biosynthetic protein FliO [Deltaproteobacteria bacterium]|jgi:flagellar biogenesis protein FliO|nr:flagellar biosynthetic protein FliO [Deltaproteobacteria bacterium]
MSFLFSWSFPRSFQVSFLKKIVAFFGGFFLTFAFLGSGVFLGEVSAQVSLISFGQPPPPLPEPAPQDPIITEDLTPDRPFAPAPPITSPNSQESSGGTLSESAPTTPGSANPPAVNPPSAAPSTNGSFSPLFFKDESSFVSSLFKVVGAFLLVLAVLLIFLKLLGRFTRKVVKGGVDFTLQGTMSLDAKRYLAAVEVAGKLLIIGVTQERITPLAILPTGNDVVNLETPIGELDLERALEEEEFAFEPPKRKKKPVPRPGVKEPSFYRGEIPEGSLEDEVDAGVAAETEEFQLGIDEEGFTGPETNDDFRDISPKKKR